MSIKKLKIFSVLSFFALTLLIIPIPKAHAASKTIELTTTIASDDPFIALGREKASDTGVNLSEPLDNLTTRSDSTENETNGPWGYTWHINMPTLCTGAELLSLRIVTNTQTQNEAPLSGIILALYSGNDTLVFRNNYTINNGKGEDLDSWFPFEYSTPAVDRGIGFEGLFPAGLGFGGQLDATWDLSSYNQGDTLGIYLQHWISESATIAQTTLQSVELAYDDSGCSGPAQNISNPITSQPIVLSTPSGSTITNASTAKESGLSVLDPAYNYPVGLVSFSFNTSQSDNEVSLIFVTDKIPSQVVARKYNPSSNAYFTISGAAITETTYNNQHALKLTYTITDNGDLDLDPITGQISDPVGLAQTKTTAPDTGLGKYWLLNQKDSTQ